MNRFIAGLGSVALTGALWLTGEGVAVAADCGFDSASLTWIVKDGKDRSEISFGPATKSISVDGTTMDISFDQSVDIDLPGGAGDRLEDPTIRTAKDGSLELLPMPGHDRVVARFDPADGTTKLSDDKTRFRIAAMPVELGEPMSEMAGDLKIVARLELVGSAGCFTLDSQDRVVAGKGASKTPEQDDPQAGTGQPSDSEVHDENPDGETDAGDDGSSGALWWGAGAVAAVVAIGGVVIGKRRRE